MLAQNQSIGTETQKLPANAIKDNTARLPDLQYKRAHAASIAATCPIRRLRYEG